ncbi:MULTISPECIES: hypothetical protein [Ruegeria]|uniref:Integral membrane protein n=1 Tax=Ruegeria atlantica TaxID=81569 RepID=A0A0P1EIW1_9RHOB|nr:MULTISPECIES: hypothetical protein [Ruegeria]CUH50434.1 hypothetical protein RUA4292_04643 [Ruegeria atlantica]
MHRKFIAFIVATAITITGVSASQARAADAKDILGGLAAIAIIGAGVHYYNKEKRKDRTTRHQTYTPQPYVAQPSYPVRPLPQHVARYDLPQKCLRKYSAYSNNHPLLAPKCLKKHYKHANSLPQECKVGFWNGNKVNRAYEPACLRQKGYRVVYK